MKNCWCIEEGSFSVDSKGWFYEQVRVEQGSEKKAEVVEYIFSGDC